MANEINRIPLGLLDLVQAQTGGKNPSELPQILASTLELTFLYGAQTLAATNTSFTDNQVGPFGNIVITPPDSEVWVLLGTAVAEAFTAAGERTVYGVNVDRLPRSGGGPGSDAYIALHDLSAVNAPSSDLAVNNFTTLAGLTVQSGSRIKLIRLSRDGGVDRGANWYLRYYRLTV